MVSKTERYSLLGPMDLACRIQVAEKALRFFSPVHSNEIKSLLSIPNEQGGITPVPVFRFLDYLSSNISDFDAMKNLQNIRMLLDKMEYAGVLVPMGASGNVMLPKDYFYLRELTDKQKLNGYWFAEFLGADFIYSYFSDFTVQITGVVTCTGNAHAGTGIIINDHLILTCKHVLAEMDLDEEQYFQGRCIKVKKIHVHDTIDVGILQLEGGSLNVRGAACFRDPILDDELFVLGYPPIPYSRESSLVLQKGEVTNPNVTSLDGFTFFLFSAIARPGNSGGPIISRSGNIVGIVTREFSLQNSNNFPFFAGIPCSVIINALDDMGFHNVLSVEDYQ